MNQLTLPHTSTSSKLALKETKRNLWGLRNKRTGKLLNNVSFPGVAEFVPTFTLRSEARKWKGLVEKHSRKKVSVVKLHVE